MAVFVTVWVLCAGCSAVIAGGKGRDPVGWFVLGLLFGVFAIVAVAAMPAVRAERQDDGPWYVPDRLEGDPQRSRTPERPYY